LRNPPNDVRVMDEALRALGFQTQVVLNANQNTMKRAVRDFGSRAQGADVAMLYYSGHGTQAQGENYLIPVQAVIEKESDYEVEAVSANAVLRQIAGARPKAAVVVLDACRDNPVAALSKSGTKGLGRMEAPTGTLVAFATAPNTTASDEGHYARVLSAQLRRPGTELLDAFRNTTAEVLKLSGGRQEPRVSEVSISERIYLAGSTASVSPEPVSPPTLPSQGAGLSLDDLKKEQQAREQWAAWQGRMKADFDAAAAFTGGPDLQAKAWERFLATWAQDNPYGQEDDALRGQARQRLERARTSASAPTPASLATVTTPSGSAAQALPGSSELVVRLGHVAPTSGAIAHLGKDNELGMRMALDELNTRGIVIGGRRARFQLLAEDDAADPRQGTQAAQRLVNAGVSGVIGHLNSGTSIPASRIYSDAGIPQISPSATNPRFTRQGFKTTFRVIADDAQLASILGRYAVTKLRATSIAVIDDRTFYGQGMAEEFVRAVQAAGGTVVAREFTHDRATDFTAVLTQVRARNPDLIFFGGMDAVAGPMLRQMGQLGMRSRFMGGDGICTSGLSDLAKGGMQDEQVLCAESGGVRSNAMTEFQDRFRAKFGTDVQVYAPYVYDAALVMVDAMVRAGSAEPANYLPHLAATRSFKGVTGAIGFDAKGDLLNGTLTLYTYRGGKRMELEQVR
jgi:branched-chain amino acid transport system substrate-binding protein